MRRPSYLQQVAAPPPRRGVVVLAPPRIAFRPGAAEFTVEDVRAPAASPSRDPMRGAAPQAVAPTPTRTVEVAAPAPAPRVPSVAQALREAAASVTPARRGDASAVERSGPAPRPTLIAPPSQPPLPGRTAAAPAASAATPLLSPIAPARPEPSAARPSRPATTDSPGAPTELRPAQPAVASAPPAQSAVAPQREIEPPPPALRAAAQAITPASAPPPAPSVVPAAAMALIMPPPPPPRAPAPAARERATPGLHIGTLEVRIVAPTSPPATFAPPRPAPSRAVARSPASRGGGIARGFSVFGLGQS